MKTLDRYVLRELAVPFVVGLVGFELLMLGNIVYLYLPLLGQNHLPWWSVLRLLALRAPEVAVYGLPFSTLVATAWGLNRLSRESEITALRMGGISVRRVLLPALGAGLAVSVVAFLNNEQLAPRASRHAERMVRQLLLNEPAPFFREDTFLRVPPNMYVYVHRVDARTHRFFDLILWELTGARYPLITTARQGHWEGPVLVLEDGVRHTFRADGRFEREERFGQARVNIRTAAGLAPSQKTSREMSARELSHYIDTFRRSGLVVRSLELDLYFKYSLPLAPFICALLAAPLALRFGRAGSLAGLLIAFVLTFTYQVLMAWSRMLGEAGTVPAPVAAWSQNAVFALLGGWLLSRQE